MIPDGSWRPTAAYLRGLVLAVLGAAVAVLARRPDVVVLVAPIVVVAAWSAATRPRRAPRLTQSIDHETLWEGQATTWRFDVVDDEGRLEDMAVALPLPTRIETRPESGQRAISVPDDDLSELAVGLCVRRWGRHTVLPAVMAGSSAWGAHRVVTIGQSSRSVLALPQSAGFDASAPPVNSPGLVGAHRSPRPGSGTEFATIRPFQPGDRLRRIHWPETLRSGTTHVRSTFADHDRHVQVVVDALSEIGVSDGIDGESSSLDIAVRAAAAIAEHHVTAGDRVSVVVLDGRGVKRVPPGSGHRHLRRILEVLSNASMTVRSSDSGAVPRSVGNAELVVLLSPLSTLASITRAVTMASRGARVVAIDCLPRHLTQRRHTDEFADLAWRLEMLERERRLRRAADAGLAVVPWVGPGSLDRVLRELGRHGPGHWVGRR